MYRSVLFSVLLLMLPPLIGILLCFYAAWYVNSRESALARGELEAERINAQQAESINQAVRLSYANARIQASNSLAAATRMTGMGIFLMMFPVTVLGIRLYVCEKRLNLYEKRLRKLDYDVASEPFAE